MDLAATWKSDAMILYPAERVEVEVEKLAELKELVEVKRGSDKTVEERTNILSNLVLLIS
jgi:hypothetical protein